MRCATKMNDDAYPPMPERMVFSIGEAAKLARVKPHTARYWEKSIPQLRALVLRRGGRRYFKREAVLMLRRIDSLVRDEACTIAGVKKRLDAKSGANGANAIEFARGEIEKIIKLL